MPLNLVVPLYLLTKSKNLHGNFIEKIKRTIYLSQIHYFNPHNKDYETRVRPFTYNKNFGKENIILMGCSFAYGDGLNENENFGALLSEQTSRNVIFIVKYLSLLVYHKILSPIKKDSKLMTLYLTEINNEVEFYFKNKENKPSQFVILQYEDDEDIEWKKLKENGIKIINANSLTGKNLKLKEYRQEDWHPNAKAWEIIIPKLIKELNL